MPFRSITQVCKGSINTVIKLLVGASMACAVYYDKIVCNVDTECIQSEKIVNFC